MFWIKNQNEAISAKEYTVVYASNDRMRLAEVDIFEQDDALRIIVRRIEDDPTVSVVVI